MATILIEQIVDDIDGTELDEYETVRWGLDGKQYEFDTSPKNAEKFRSLVGKYLEASRKGGGGQATRRPPGTASRDRSKEQTQLIRDWANKNGHEVSDRGRIPLAVIAEFEAAH